MVRVRPALLYAFETWPVDRSQKQKLEVTEMKMLRWNCGCTKLDKIKNEDF